MIYFVGAGPGAVDLITVRGHRLLGQADVVVYAGSLVNPALLDLLKDGCTIYNSAGMTLEEVMEVLTASQQQNLLAVRLHTGDPSLYGAIREQMDWLEREGLCYQVVPGVSSFSAAAAAMSAEYTLPGVSQSLVITRVAGRTPVPEGEDLAMLASHGSSMAIFLSTGLLEKLTQKLLEGGYRPDDPVAVVYKASWPDEKVVHTTVSRLAEDAAANGISSTALVLAGGFLNRSYQRSKLYDPAFGHRFREVEK